MKKENNKLLKNVGLLTLGSFSSKLLGFFLIPLYTAVLSTEEYGAYDLIVTTASLLFPLTSVAISEAIMRFSLDKGADRKSIYTSGLTVIALGYVVLLLVMPILKASMLGPYLGYFYIYYGIRCVNTITGYFVKGLERVAVFSISGITSTAITVTSNIIFLVWFGWGIQGYLLSTILANIVSTAYMVIAAKCYKYLVSPFRINRQLLKQMLKYSVVIIPNSLSWWVASSSDKYMINYYCSMSDVGVYSVAHKIPSLIVTVMGIFISAWHLSAAEDFGSEKSKRFFSSTYNKLFSMIMAVASTLIVTSKLMAHFLYAKDFFVAYLFAPVLVVSSSFDVLASFMGSVYLAAKKSGMLAISTVSGALLNIVLNFLLIPAMGVMGAAVATASSYALIFAIRLIHSRKVLKFEIKFTRDIFLLVLLVVEVALVIVDAPWSIALSMVLFVIVIAFAVVAYKDVIMGAWLRIKRLFKK